MIANTRYKTVFCCYKQKNRPEIRNIKLNLMADTYSGSPTHTSSSQLENLTSRYPTAMLAGATSGGLDAYSETLQDNCHKLNNGKILS